MDIPNVSQFPVLVLGEPLPQPSKISQFVALGLSGPPNTPNNLTQFLLLSMISDARGYLKLENPISLNCWQPCTQYGTYSTIIYLGN